MKPEEVILVFDVGKTNKKVLLFDRALKVLHEEETRFEEVADEDGFPCEDADRLEAWIGQELDRYATCPDYLVRGVNFTTYGATLVHLDELGNRVAPIYNYLKPLPDHVLKGFHEAYGGEEEFCRRTASPFMGMLNSGIQLLWLKRTKPTHFQRIAQVLHLPQYISYLVTGQVTRSTPPSAAIQPCGILTK